MIYIEKPAKVPYYITVNFPMFDQIIEDEDDIIICTSDASTTIVCSSSASDIISGGNSRPQERPTPSPTDYVLKLVKRGTQNTVQILYTIADTTGLFTTIDFLLPDYIQSGEYEASAYMYGEVKGRTIVKIIENFDKYTENKINRLTKQYERKNKL